MMMYLSRAAISGFADAGVGEAEEFFGKVVGFDFGGGMRPWRVEEQRGWCRDFRAGSLIVVGEDGVSSSGRGRGPVKVEISAVVFCSRRATPSREMPIFGEPVAKSGRGKGAAEPGCQIARRTGPWTAARRVERGYGRANWRGWSLPSQCSRRVFECGGEASAFEVQPARQNSATGLPQAIQKRQLSLPPLKRVPEENFSESGYTAGHGRDTQKWRRRSDAVHPDMIYMKIPVGNAASATARSSGTRRRWKRS